MVNRISDLAKEQCKPITCGTVTASHSQHGQAHATEDRKPTINNTPAKAETYIGQKYVIFLRGAIVCAVGLSLLYRDELQAFSDNIYTYLLSTSLFNSVYFETFWATFCYAVIIPMYPWLVAKQPWLDRYKLAVHVTYVPTTVWRIFVEALIYMAPLMLLDTVMIKKYCGVDPRVLEEKRDTFIQVTRALPTEPPHVAHIVLQLIASFVLYDIIFFLLHFTLHKNYYLYNYIHKHHHDHDTVHAHVTNQLTVPERIALVLSANFALKVFNSHPLTRTIFVPIFIFILVDNHTGYDMPFGLHRLVPFGLVGGAVKHYRHHMHGSRHYQPIMTYLDTALESYGMLKRKQI